MQVGQKGAYSFAGYSITGYLDPNHKRIQVQETNASGCVGQGQALTVL